MYKKINGVEAMIIGTYVGDLIIAGSNKQVIAQFKEKMQQNLEMSDLGLLSYYLGSDVQQSNL